MARPWTRLWCSAQRAMSSRCASQLSLTFSFNNESLRNLICLLSARKPHPGLLWRCEYNAIAHFASVWNVCWGGNGVC